MQNGMSVDGWRREHRRLMLRADEDYALGASILLLSSSTHTLSYRQNKLYCCEFKVVCVLLGEFKMVCFGCTAFFCLSNTCDFELNKIEIQII